MIVLVKTDTDSEGTFLKFNIISMKLDIKLETQLERTILSDQIIIIVFVKEINYSRRVEKNYIPCGRILHFCTVPKQDKRTLITNRHAVSQQLFSAIKKSSQFLVLY